MAGYTPGADKALRKNRNEPIDSSIPDVIEVAQFTPELLELKVMFDNLDPANNSDFSNSSSFKLK